MKKLKELAGNTLQKTITTSSSGEKHDFECVASTRLKLENVSNRKQDKCVLKFSEVCTPPSLSLSPIQLTARPGYLKMLIIIIIIIVLASSTSRDERRFGFIFENGFQRGDERCVWIFKRFQQ